MSKPAQKSESSTREHAEVGSSSAKGYLGCVGFKREKRPKPPHPNTVAGSRCHDALEEYNWKDLEDPIERDLCDFADAYYEKCGPYTEELQENRVYVLFDDWFGYFDRLGFKGKKVAHLFDWKFGYVPVQDAETNPQGWFFVIGVFDKYPELEHLWVHFIQPRIGEISRHKFTRKDDLPRVKAVFMSAKAEHEAFDAKGGHEGDTQDMLKPSFESCQYCGSRMECKAIRQIVQTTYRNLDESRKTEIVVPSDLDTKSIDDPNTLSQIRDLTVINEEWAKDAKWHITQKRLEDGVEIPGYKIVEKKGMTKVLDTQAVWDEATILGVPEDEIRECVTLSFSKVKKLVAKHAPNRQGSATAKQFECDMIDRDAIEVGPDSPYLKRETDNT